MTTVTARPTVSLVEFEVEGLNVQDLWVKAQATADQVSGSGTWNLVSKSTAWAVDYVDDSGLTDVDSKTVTKWGQEFKIVVDF